MRCWWVGLTERESERYGGDGRREMSPDRRARVRDRGNIWARLCCASTGIYERTQAIKVLRLRSVGAPSPPYKGSVKMPGTKENLMMMMMNIVIKENLRTLFCLRRPLCAGEAFVPGGYYGAPPDSTNTRKLAESGSCRGVLYCCAKEGATCAMRTAKSVRMYV